MTSKKQKKEELHLGENDLTTWVENKLGHLMPYASQIGLAIALIFATGVGIAYFINYRQTAYADQWRELHLANTDFRLGANNTTRLMNVAEDYPNQKAGLWSLQLAGDFDLRTGISQLSYDREGGFVIIKRAKENLQKIVDASSKIKSTELQRRSLFSLAYACESLGEFEEAKQHYQQLVDDAPDSAFAEPARRGAARCSNPDMIALYDTFKNWKDLDDIAPGPNVPASPNIDFPELDIEPTTQNPQSGGGDFDSEDQAASAKNEVTPVSTETTSGDSQTVTAGDTEETNTPKNDPPAEEPATSENEEGDDGENH